MTRLQEAQTLREAAFNGSVAHTTRLKFGAWSLLKLLGMKGAIKQPVVISSRELGEELGVSQQMADNYLMDLAARGLIHRTLISRKQHLTVTGPGIEVLHSEYMSLKAVFDGVDHTELTGTVVSGVGEGRYYLSKAGYVAQFRKELGYKPFPGTLNVKLDISLIHAIEGLRQTGGIRIEGFQAEGRTFGGATCFKARLNGNECHLIIPDRTHYKDVLEFMNPKNMRRTYHFKDGEKVAVEVFR